MKHWLQLIQETAQDIFQELGSGFSEAIYQQVFEVALQERQIEYEERRKVPIFFHGYFVILWERPFPISLCLTMAERLLWLNSRLFRTSGLLANVSRINKG